METQDQPQPQALPNAVEKKLIPDGVLLLLLSAYAYLCAFEHEKGYCEWFGIPQDFIRPDLSTFLLVGSSVVGVLLGGFWVFDVLFILYHDLSRRQNKVWVGLLLFQFPLLGFLTILLMADFEWTPTVIACLIVAIVWTGLELLWPLLNPKPLPFFEKWLESNRDQADAMTLLNLLRARLGAKGMLIIFVVLSSLPVCHSLGRGEARRQTDFLVTHQHPPSVVIRQYGDNFICASLDESTKTVRPTFFILKAADGPKSPLALRKIGRLTLKK